MPKTNRASLPTEDTDWLRSTPDECAADEHDEYTHSYNLTMFEPGGGSLQDVHIERSEYNALKEWLALRRGLLRQLGDDRGSDPMLRISRETLDRDLEGEFRDYIRHADYEARAFLYSALVLRCSNDCSLASAIVAQAIGGLPKDVPDIRKLVELRKAVRAARKSMEAGHGAILGEIFHLAE